MASQDPCTILRVLGFSQQYCFPYFLEEEIKQVLHSLYQTLYSTGVTKAQTLLICDLVLEEHQGS